ncbi:MAG: arsenate reductase ArsC [Elusimicrobia bacterium]|nr:arsenate reductase ArsC [Elusimicrobiota bacterium]
MKARILFVCVENSCRSQMAEGFAREFGGARVEVYSAGSRPSGKVNPTAVAVLREHGIDISKNASKAVSDLPATGWDYVVTMGCGDACPFVPAKARLDWKIPDPKNLPLAEFRKVADLVASEVRRLLEDVK